MTLPRKRPGDILKRDREFTQAIGKPASDRPNPFDMVGKELKEKLDAARPREGAEMPPAEAAPVGPASRTEEAATHDLPATETPPQSPSPQSGETAQAPYGPNGEPPQSANKDRRVEIEAAIGAPDNTKAAASINVEAKAGKARRADAPGQVVITMRIPTYLVKRAETWAGAVGLRPATVLRNCFNRFKPELLEEFKTIKAGDVRLDRSESVGHHMQAQIQFTPAEIADMEARLDPAGFGVLRSMLNHHARARFSTFLDELMAKAGY